MPIHVASEFYDVAGFKAGEPQVQPFEVDELGPLGGMKLVHLQCHFGLDTLDLVRMHPELTAVGLDFSRPAIEAATALASEVGLSNRARFVQAEVQDAGRALGQEQFDVVYTGKGALCWLPDLHDWAAECAGLLRPGGSALRTSLSSTRSEAAWTRRLPSSVTTISIARPSRRSPRALTPTWRRPQLTTCHTSGPTLCHRSSMRFSPPTSSLRFFHEWDYSSFEQTKWLEKGPDGAIARLGPGKLPLMYSLKAQKPE